jgi:hypothetical protein
MAKMEKLRAVMTAFRKRITKAIHDNGISVVVGYTAAYAVYVHENLEAKHKEGKQAKFLEQPARELTQEFREIIFKTLSSGGTVAEALLMCGLRLQRESQKIVPIDTGALKNSAFTRLEKVGTKQ